MRSLGIDIGGSSVKVAMFDEGSWRFARSVPYQNPSRDELTKAIQGVIAEFETGINESMPVGLCLPGRQNASGDRIERAVNLPCLEDWAFNKLLHESLGYMPNVYTIETDIHATTIDLVRSMQFDGRVAVIAIGTGVGLCVCEDGAMLSIGSGGIGHLGQVDVGRMGEEDAFGIDGSINTLESYIGLLALRARFGDLQEAEIVERIRSLDSDDPLIRALVQALRIVHAIYRPSCVVLAGGVGLALAPKRELIYEHVNDRLTTLAQPHWELRFGESLYHAASGAARLALD